MARKHAGEPASKKQQAGTLVRVSDEFAELLKRASSVEGMSIAEFASTYLAGPAEARYRDVILQEAKRMGGEPSPKGKGPRDPK